MEGTRFGILSRKSLRRKSFRGTQELAVHTLRKKHRLPSVENKIFRLSSCRVAPGKQQRKRYGLDKQFCGLRDNRLLVCLSVLVVALVAVTLYNYLRRRTRVLTLQWET